MTKTATRKPAKKKPTRKANPALDQFFERVKKGQFKFPRKLRRAVIKELDGEKKKFTGQVKDYALKIRKPANSSNPFEDVPKLPKFKSRFVELFNENYQPQNFDMPDLLNPRQKTKSQLGKVIWLEKGVSEVPATETTPAELHETAWRPAVLDPTQVGKYFDEKKTELKESDGFDYSSVNGSVPLTGAMAGKYFPFPPNSFTRQMYIPDSWFMLARAAHCYNYNPLAKAMVDIKTSFIVGNGPTIIINDNPALSKCWKDFEKTEDFVETLRTWIMMLGVNGELFIEFYTNVLGKPSVHSIDPGHVYEIITEPRDLRQVYGYKLMYQTQVQLFGTGAKGETVPLSEWIYETISPDNIMHIKTNVQENEKRGRSDLLPALAILQLFEDYIRYKVLRAIVEAAFVWDVKMTGADQDQIDSFLADEEQAFPTPGSTRAHNENTEWKSDGNQSGGSGRDEVFEMLLTIAAVSHNLPKEYVGASGSGSRANAITSTEPSVKAFQARRRKGESLIMRIIDFLASSNNIPYDPDQVECSWEEIAPEDVSKKIDRLYTEMDRDTFTKKRVDEMIAKLEGVSNYDWVKEIADRLIEKTSGPVKSLADGSPVTTPAGAGMAGTGLDQPEGGKPVAAPAAAPAPGSPALGAPGTKTAATSPATSGAPSSLSAQDKLDVKKQGKTL